MDWIWYHALPLIVFGVPLIGFLWELLVGLLCRKNCWLLSLPVLAGALGLALCLLAQSSLSLSFLLGFWAAYGCALLFGWSLSQLRTTGDLRWKKWICRGMALCSGAALLALELGILAVKYLFLSVFSGDGWSSPLLLVYSVFLLLLYFAWVALFAALLALLIYPILKKLRI